MIVAAPKALYRRARDEVSWFARHCGTRTDRQRAAAVLGDLYHLTGQRIEKRPFAERARTLLLTHWRAVKGVASALIDNDGRLEGRWAKWIVDFQTGLDPPLIQIADCRRARVLIGSKI